MGKTSSEKSSTGASRSVERDGAGAAAPGAPPGSSATEEPAEPIERARLLAEVARQRVRIAKEELKRARKRVKEAKREAKRARKQAAAARKAWKKARKAHRSDSAPQASPGKRTRHTQLLKGSARRGKAKSTRRRRTSGSNTQTDGSVPVT